MIRKSQRLMDKIGGQHESTTSLTDDQTNVPSDEEENEGDWFERADHPLLNEVVLKLVFGYASGIDLKSNRLVSKKWNILTIPFTRSRLLVTISGSKSIQPTGIQKFMKQMRSNTLGYPFGRFRLGPFVTTKGFGQEFVQVFGISTKELILTEWTSDCHLVENVSELLRGMPKLESFTMPTLLSSKDGSAVELFPGTKPKLNFLKTLITRRDNAKNRVKICPTFFDELFESAQNVSTFELTSQLENDLPLESLEILKTLDKLGRHSSIENIALADMMAEHLTLLMEMGTKGMKLKKLVFRYRKYFINSSDWIDLVELFKNSLTSLNIGGFCHQTSSIIFPTMSKLIQFNLQLTLSHMTNVRCENFAMTFPALKKLQLCLSSENVQVENFLTGDDCSTMNSLIFGYHSKITTMGMLNRVLEVFPNLTMFDCQVRERDGYDVVRKILTHMKQLKGLRIGGTLASSENVDSLLTGIPLKDIRKIRLNPLFRSLGQMTIIQRENALEQIMMSKIYQLPTIRNLKTYFGLYWIKTLRHLYVSQSQFSKDCCKVLVTDLGLISWNFESGTNYMNFANIIPSRLNLNDEYVCE